MGEKFKFFTDNTVECDYCLVNSRFFLDFNNKLVKHDKIVKISKEKKEVLLDPGVRQLISQDYYLWEKWLDLGTFLNEIPRNCYFSADYPSDMNVKYTKTFLSKSWKNAVKYCDYRQYIVTTQFEFGNFFSFKKWFDKYNDLSIASSIMGIGNFCCFRRINKFLVNCLDYIASNCNHKRIHIYGPCLELITGTRIVKGKPIKINLSLNDYIEQFGIEISVDSTKWTITLNKVMRSKNEWRGSCNSSNRSEFFIEYIKAINDRFKQKGNIIKEKKLF